MSEFETVIGMEVHAELLTKTKLFCGCSTKFGEPPNTQTCPVCLGLPGVLPVLNKRAVEMVIKTALALNCQVSEFCKFSRKNYYYPDLPKNYQISMYEFAIGRNGYIDIVTNNERRRIRIRRVHLEEEAGKMVHPDPYTSLVDYNRTGIPLMEIVTEPDIRSPEEAIKYLTELRSILQYLGVCSGDMEKGVFRCESNISVRPVGSQEFGTRIELKNLNSFKAVQKGLTYEVQRQSEILSKGGKIIQETRRFDDETERTEPMRWKEEAQDYRYFPEPDLVPLVISREWIEEIKVTLPELPGARRERFISQYQLPPYDAEVLTSSKALADFFEECLKKYPNAKTISNWLMGDVSRLLNLKGVEISESLLTPDDLVNMLKLIDQGIISGKIAKTVLEEMFDTGKSAERVVEERGLVQITEEKEIAKVINEVIDENPQPVAEFKAGKEKALGFLVGQVMKKTQGRANPQLVNKLLREKLS